MKPHRILSLLLVAAFLFGLMTAFAEGERMTQLFNGTYLNISYATEFNGKSLFIVHEKSWDYGIYAVDEDGYTVAVPRENGQIDYRGAAYFSVADYKNTEDRNNCALMDAEGNVLTPYVYYSFDVISENWVAAKKIAPSDSDVSDLSSGSTKYVYSEIDFYYFGAEAENTESGYLVGTLNRSQYKEAKPVGDQHIVVQARGGSVQVYDSTFAPVETTYQYTTDYELTIQAVGADARKSVVSRVSGEVILGGAERLEKLSNTDRYWVQQEGMSASGGHYALMDRKGNLLTDYEYNYHSMPYDGYMVVSYGDQNSKKGLLRLSDGVLVLPCEYDNILQNTYHTSYVHDGFVCVENENKLGYVDLEGNYTCNPVFPKAAYTILGCTMYSVNPIDGTYILVAADGTVSYAIYSIEQYGNSADGYFVQVTNEDGKHGIIDWHGKTVIPTEYALKSSILGNRYVVIDNALYCLEK